MGCYVIAVGGTGNKILESIVYAAGADAFYTLESDGARKPIERLDMLSVDVDAACGNTTRAKRAAESYEKVRRSFDGSPFSHRCFHTQVCVDRWSTDLSRRASSVEQMSQNHQSDRLLARTLFSSAEMQLEYSEGFRGHPDLGVLFFADMLSSLDQSRRSGQTDELNALIDRMENDIARGDTVKLILCGSIFGGTGASGIPALSKYFYRRFAGRRERFVMGAMLMLPYYKVPPANADPAREIVVESDSFLDKARTALQYYGMESMIRDGEADENGLFDAVYLLGLPPEHFVSTRIYSTGSQSQENDAHMLEWLATRCVARFMRTGFRGPDAGNIDCYYYQSHTPYFCWDSFDEDAAFYRARYGALLKAASVFFAECYPTLHRLMTRHDRKSARVSYCSAYFRGLRRMRAEKRAGLESELGALRRYLAFYVNWFAQVMDSLPSAMRDPAGGLLHPEGLPLLKNAVSSHPPDGSELLKLLDQLIVSPVPDKRGARRVLQGLGGGESVSSAPMAAFLTALLNAVYEGE